MNESIKFLVPFTNLSAYIFQFRAKFEEILELLTYSFVIFIILNALLYVLIHRYRGGSSKFRFLRPSKLPDNASRVLLVTAHPDDECMFFGPTLIALKKRSNCRIFVLCLSKGKASLPISGFLVAQAILYSQVTTTNKVMREKMSCGILAECST